MHGGCDNLAHPVIGNIVYFELQCCAFCGRKTVKSGVRNLSRNLTFIYQNHVPLLPRW